MGVHPLRRRVEGLLRLGVLARVGRGLLERPALAKGKLVLVLVLVLVLGLLDSMGEGLIGPALGVRRRGVVEGAFVGVVPAGAGVGLEVVGRVRLVAGVELAGGLGAVGALLGLRELLERRVGREGGRPGGVGSHGALLVEVEALLRRNRLLVDRTGVGGVGGLFGALEARLRLLVRVRTGGARLGSGFGLEEVVHLLFEDGGFAVDPFALDHVLFLVLEDPLY